ncbi:MAG: polysaccharide deacetylase family protein [Bacteroidetes bacterium]|nr:polysaccharide deacetylase family protein [Bacteroidota bacterium]MBS1972889.1 polysaccharide deacetylase family protein [Bacteroidota bacterium]
MLNFKNTNIFFAALLAGLIAISFYTHISFSSYLLALAAYSMALFYGSYFIRAGFYIKSVCSASTSKKEIAITFDDGPASAYTAAILKVMEEHHVEAAFFCIGNRIDGNENLLLQIKAGGHIIGNHSNSHHFWFDLFSSKKILADLRLMDEKVKSIIGNSPKLFRPPYGVTNPNVKKAIVKGNYTSVGWSIRSMDTTAKDDARLMEKLKKAINPGSIILFHDTCEITLSILPGFIEYVKAEGYQITRLDKMCNLQAYA